MPDGPSAQVDNQDIILRLMYGSEDGLRQLLKAYGPKVKGALMRRFAGILDGEDVDAVINLAACKARKSINGFRHHDGNLGGWFYRIAYNAAIETIKGEQPARRHIPEEYEPIDELAEDRASAICDAEGGGNGDGDGDGEADRRLLRDFDECINALPNQQRRIMLADRAVGGSADAGFLAKKLNTAKGTIYVQRSKAHETLRQEMRKRGHFRDPQRSSHDQRRR